MQSSTLSKRNAGGGIFLLVDNNLQLYDYCDSDWGDMFFIKKSLMGYFVTLRGPPIS